MRRVCTCCGEAYDDDGGLQEALDLFERAHGRKARDGEELEQWLDRVEPLAPASAIPSTRTLQ